MSGGQAREAARRHDRLITASAHLLKESVGGGADRRSNRTPCINKRRRRRQRDVTAWYWSCTGTLAGRRVRSTRPCRHLAAASEAPAMIGTGHLSPGHFPPKTTIADIMSLVKMVNV